MNEIKKVELADIDLLVNLIKKNLLQQISGRFV